MGNSWLAFSGSHHRYYSEWFISGRDTMLRHCHMEIQIRTLPVAGACADTAHGLWVRQDDLLPETGQRSIRDLFLTTADASPELPAGGRFRDLMH